MLHNRMCRFFLYSIILVQFLQQTMSVDFDEDKEDLDRLLAESASYHTKQIKQLDSFNEDGPELIDKLLAKYKSAIHEHIEDLHSIFDALDKHVAEEGNNATACFYYLKRAYGFYTEDLVDELHQCHDKMEIFTKSIVKTRLYILENFRKILGLQKRFELCDKSDEECLSDVSIDIYDGFYEFEEFQEDVDGSIALIKDFYESIYDCFVESIEEASGVLNQETVLSKIENECFDGSVKITIEGE